jgi:hypothetical protein
MSIRRGITIVLGALLLTLGLAGGAAAQPYTDNDDASVTITENTGGLSVALTASDFGNVQYSFTNQLTSGDLTINLIDARGTRAGWSVNLRATDFTGSNGTITVNNLTLKDGSITTNTGTPHGNAPAQTFVSPFSPTVTFANIWTAPNGGGDGNYDLDYETELNVPGLTLAGTYTSTIYVEIPTGP